MTSIMYQGQTYKVADGETVLTSLLRAGVNIPNSCQAGVCQSCLMRTTTPLLPAKAQAGLKDTMKAQGYFMACVCQPETDLVLADLPKLRIPADIVSIDNLSDSVKRIRLQVSEPFDYHPGQFIGLYRADGLVRSYSLASLPADGFLELHVRRLTNGQMSNWLHDEAQVGEMVEIQGPLGDCFYTPGRSDQTLVLAGTGTGLAPLYAILRDALQQGHQGDIWLFHGALDYQGLYLVAPLIRLAKLYPQVKYIPCLRSAESETLPSLDNMRVGELDEIVIKNFPGYKGLRAFLCGDPQIVNRLKKRLFIAGVSLKEIFADAFISAPSQ